MKDIAEEVISLPLPGVEGRHLNPGDIWLDIILACVNQNSNWDTCNDTDGTPFDDTVLTWLHTLNHDWLEVVARPRRGGRDLPEEFTFETFCDLIRHDLKEELRRRWKIKANGVGVPASQATAAG